MNQMASGFQTSHSTFGRDITVSRGDERRARRKPSPISSRLHSVDASNCPRRGGALNAQGSQRPHTTEKFARLEKPLLLDKLFALFRDRPHWGLPALRITLEQPDAWLREVLPDVAEQVKEGPYMSMWRLKREWEDPGVKGEEMIDGEVEGDEEMEDFDEDDFEEV